MRTRAFALTARIVRSLSLPLALLRRSAGAHACGAQHGTDFLRCELEHLSPLDARRHRNGSITRADEPADGETQRLEKPADLAIAALVQHDVIPVVRPFAAAVLELLDLG